MAAWLIGHMTVRDPVKWQEYLGQVGATVADAGGEVVFRGHLWDQVCDEAPGQLVVAIRFADPASLRFLEDLKVFPILPQKEDKRRDNGSEDSQSDGDSAQVKSGK